VSHFNFRFNIAYWTFSDFVLHSSLLHQFHSILPINGSYLFMPPAICRVHTLSSSRWAQ
jgi:hypothetical protein